MPAPPRAGPAPQFGTRHLIRVVINAAEGPGTYSREAELRGLVTVMMESGLADLPDVVPEVEGRGPSPGLARPLKLDEHVWTGLLKVEGEAPSLTLSFTLCSPEGPCAGMTSTTTVDRPEEALVELLRGSARALARSPSAEAEARWAEPVSMDSYGALLLGRSAAVWYGLMEPPPPELVGDHRADAITRAVLVDPSMSQAWWIRGRRAWALAD